MEFLSVFIGMLIATLITLALVSILVSNYLVTMLLDGKIVGTFDGFIGEYILKTFRVTNLYHRGTGLPVTLTNKPYYKSTSGTIIFLTQSVHRFEECKCKLDLFTYEPLVKNNYWWTKEINRNSESNDFGRFDNNLDEPLTVPFWYFRIGGKV